MDPEQQHEYIEAYLNDKMDAGQRAAFEQALAKARVVRYHTIRIVSYEDCC